MAVIYQTYRMAEAQVLAHVVHDRAEAELWVYQVASRGLARGDACWQVTRNRGEASTRVYFGSRGRAKLLIYFVRDRGQAGWRKAHTLRGKL